MFLDELLFTIWMKVCPTERNMGRGERNMGRGGKIETGGGGGEIETWRRGRGKHGERETWGGGEKHGRRVLNDTSESVISS